MSFFPERSIARANSRLIVCMAVMVALSAGTASVHAQHHVPKRLDGLVQEAGAIEMVQLQAARSRWNDRGNLIVTDYEFVRERDLLNDGAPGERLVLTQAGGIVGNEGQSMSGNPNLEIGSRYILFVDPEHGTVFTPFVSGEFGVYRIDSDGSVKSLAGRKQYYIDDLLGEIADLVDERAGALPVRYPAVWADGESPYPSKTYVPIHLAAPVPSQQSAASASPLAEEETAGPDAPIIDPGLVVAVPHEHGAYSPFWNVPNYHHQRTVNAPVVYDELPHDWEWSPIDQHQMADWNVFGGNVFRISGTQLGTWAWGNDRFEMVGFPDNATMIAQFGQGWGANSLAIAWQRWNASNVIIEVDIAFNPARCWTLNLFEAARPEPNNCWNFRRSALHELGHGWGLDHPFEFDNVWWDSVMNYPPKELRHARLSTDDTTAIRNRYNGPSTGRTLISQWLTDDNPSSQHARYTMSLPSSRQLRHGQSLTGLGNFQVENLGPSNFVNPNVEVWLSQNWETWDNATSLLRTLNISATIPSHTIHNYVLPSIAIPATVPTGRYYLSLFLRNGQGPTRYNTSSSRNDRTVTVNNNVATLAPTEQWKVTGTGRIGPLGVWDFTLPVVAGSRYELTTCSASGGSANFDTRIAITGTGGASNDDACGLQSRLLWTAPSTGNRTVRVDGFNINAQGQFTMAYRRVITDRIFANGFQQP